MRWSKLCGLWCLPSSHPLVSAPVVITDFYYFHRPNEHVAASHVLMCLLVMLVLNVNVPVPIDSENEHGMFLIGILTKQFQRLVNLRSQCALEREPIGVVVIDLLLIWHCLCKHSEQNSIDPVDSVTVDACHKVNKTEIKWNFSNWSHSNPTFLDNLILIHLHSEYRSPDFELITIDNNYPCGFGDTKVGPSEHISDGTYKWFNILIIYFVFLQIHCLIFVIPIIALGAVESSE